MELGVFTMPSHPPERSLYDGHIWDLQALRWADEFGYQEARVGEHHTCPWEPHPAPDLLIAQAFRETAPASASVPKALSADQQVRSECIVRHLTTVW